VSTTDHPPKDPNTSWWVDDFDENLPKEQARMRRELLSEAIDAYFATHLKREEAELLIKKRRGGK